MAALLPTLVTVYILVKLVEFLYNNFGQYIGLGLTQLITWAYEKSGRLPADQIAELERDLTDSWEMAIVGFFLALLAVCVIGLLLASFVGRRLWRVVEKGIIRLPVVKQIYPYVKQVTDYLFGEKRMEFSSVVAAEYPRRGVWSVGFVTGRAIPAIGEINKSYMTVFIPSSPTPLTGYVITILKEDTIKLPITIDQAIRFLISGGVITPDVELPALKVEEVKNKKSKMQDIE